MSLVRLLRKPFSYTFNNFSFYLIFINVVVYFVQKYFRQHGVFLEDFFALNTYFFVKDKMFWQAFTYMFLHGDFWHLFFNMLMLFGFGVSVEQKVGSKEFLLFYVLCGTLAGLAMGILYYLTGTYSYVLGASAALYAVMLSFAVLYPDSRVYLYFVLPIPTAVLLLAYFILELVQAFASDGIAHLGHLFGLIFGWLYIKVRYRISILKVFGFR